MIQNNFIRPIAVFSVILVTVAVVNAQIQEGKYSSDWPIDPDASPRPIAQASRASTSIIIDGRLEEEAWNEAVPITEFVQTKPDAGYPATEDTEVRILFDDKNLYIGAICFDSNPDKLVVKTLEREFPGLSTHEMDIFSIYLDTFLDRKNSFTWLVNPKGAYRDGQTFDDSRNLNYGWEGVAYIKTEIGDYGWTVEMNIPWTTLRFDPSRGNQIWGANFMRRVRHRNEESFWAPLDRRDRGHRMSKAGTMKGLPKIQPGRNLMFTPFVMSGIGSQMEVSNGLIERSQDAGFDMKYGITPRMTMDLTYQTDFSQVEVDQERVNLSRFPLFFPEKRDFFLENSGTFQFGDVKERSYRTGSSLRDFTLFHSRRIGLIDGLPIPIIGGGRLTGHAGAFEIGLLNVQTKAFKMNPPENFTILRMRRMVKQNTDVGFMFGNRQATDGRGLYNQSFGIDANIKLLKSMIINSYFALTREPGLEGNNKAARIAVGWRDRLWDIGAFARQIGEDFNPGVGFVRRRNIRHVYGTIGAHPRPQIPFVLELNPYLEGHYIMDLKDVLQTSTATMALKISFLNGALLDLLYNGHFEHLEGSFEVLPKAVVQRGDYNFHETAVKYTSNKGRPISGTVKMTKGGYFDGSRNSIEGDMRLEVNYHLAFEMYALRNNFTIQDRSYTADIYGAKLKYAYSTNLYFGGYMQYNASTNQVVTNFRVNLIHAPLSDIFIVYNERRDLEGGNLKERYLILKLTKCFST
ncbi:MAG: DUF5916 domain-containing protein [Candidatus Peribacteraceae bacterium]|jgi:hypothetical protein|nr:DUF5916 domain-containing protein [Candidatus Peribacteraceae bacterium]|tara:strand:+ start:927 stop:3164 length:2238 start_codon:yes stop_codon:yes gene_type:complete